MKPHQTYRFRSSDCITVTLAPFLRGKKTTSHKTEPKFWKRWTSLLKPSWSAGVLLQVDFEKSYFPKKKRNPILNPQSSWQNESKYSTEIHPRSKEKWSITSVLRVLRRIGCRNSLTSFLRHDNCAAFNVFNLPGVWRVGAALKASWLYHVALFMRSIFWTRSISWLLFSSLALPYQNRFLKLSFLLAMLPTCHFTSSGMFWRNGAMHPCRRFVNVSGCHSPAAN